MNTEGQPLVSCVMPTYNRRPFIAHAIRYFLRQDYERKELIILDDGPDAIRDLVPDSNMIRYYRLEQRINLGAKLNLACSYAKGDLIANWDDDDWYAERRLQYQVDHLLQGTIDVCGINRLLYYDLRNHCAYRYVYPSDQRAWLLGSSLCYTREFWNRNHFQEIDVGMDGLFVRRVSPTRVKALSDETISVHMIHDHNISPKNTDDGWWHKYPVSEIQKIVNSDWQFYGGPAPVAVPQRPFTNLFACLVHENPSCIIDLVRNLHCQDPDSIILLYNGGNDPALLRDCLPFEKFGAIVHPDPTPVSHGYLHPFALKCMEYALDNLSFDTVTIIDSDQLCVRPGYTACLERFFTGHPDTGLLSNRPQRVTAEEKNVHTAIQAFKEYALWKPFLSRFPGGEDKFVHWTFWPSTVFSAAACRDLTKIFRDDLQLQDIMRQTKIWATEEIILPTLVSLLGYEIADTPFKYDFVKYKTSFTIRDIDQALAREDVYWVHPIRRTYEEPLRQHIRHRFSQYARKAQQSSQHAVSGAGTTRFTPRTAQPATPGLFRPLTLIDSLHGIEGWLDDKEADLLIGILLKACREPAQGAARNIVEIGSYHGKATVLLATVVREFCPEAVIVTIDPHDGILGALDRGLTRHPPSYDKLRQNIEKAGLTGLVKIIKDRSCNVKWQGPISLLLIDGLHDYPNVSRDFWHFAPWVTPGGYICFHDYAEYYPGVTAFVDELTSGDGYSMAALAGSLAIIQKI